MNLSKLQKLCFLAIPSFFVWFGASILPVNAAQKVVLSAGIHQVSIPIEELQNFAENGQLSPALEDIFSASKRDPEISRNALTKEVPVDLILADKTLNHPLGELLLDKLSIFVHPPSSTANRQAMRAAIVLSASEDNQVSLLEIIENYPASELHIEGDRLVEASEKLRQVSDGVKQVLGRIPDIFR